MTNDELIYAIKEYIIKAEDTNEYVSRAFIVDALRNAEKGDIEKTILSLKQVVPISDEDHSGLVSPPDFMIILEQFLEEENKQEKGE